MEEVPWELECGDRDRGIQAEKGRERRQGGSGSSGPGSRRVGLMGGGHGGRLGFWRVEVEDSGSVCLCPRGDWMPGCPRACDFNPQGGSGRAYLSSLGSSLSPADSGPDCLGTASICYIQVLTSALSSPLPQFPGLGFPNHRVRGLSLPCWPPSPALATSSSRVEGTPPPPELGVAWGKGSQFSDGCAQRGAWGLGGGALVGTYNYCFQPEPDEGEGIERQELCGGDFPHHGKF